MSNTIIESACLKSNSQAVQCGHARLHPQCERPLKVIFTAAVLACRPTKKNCLSHMGQ